MAEDKFQFTFVIIDRVVSALFTFTKLIIQQIQKPIEGEIFFVIANDGQATIQVGIVMHAPPQQLIIKVKIGKQYLVWKK